MGKDYSSDSYKKSYSNEYVKVYDNSVTQKKKYDELRKAYNTVSKKLNDQPYSKSEKSVFEGLSSAQNSTVDSAGPQRINKGKIVRSDVLTDPMPKPKEQLLRNISSSPISSPPLPRQEKPSSSKSTAPSQRKSVKNSKLLPKIDENPLSKGSEKQSPPPYVEKGTKAIDRTVKDYSYIDINSFQAPVLPVPNGKYEDIYTKEIVDESEARRMLEYAGYRPKESLPIGWVILICVFVLFSFKFVGPIILFCIAAWTNRRKETILKKEVAGVTLRFPMPSTDKDLSRYKTQAATYTIVGILVALYQLYSLVFG